MSNPEHILLICDVLEERWERSPDLRFGQLVGILTDPSDTFGAEDTETMDELDLEFEGKYWVDGENSSD